MYVIKIGHAVLAICKVKIHLGICLVEVEKFLIKIGLALMVARVLKYALGICVVEVVIYLHKLGPGRMVMVYVMTLGLCMLRPHIQVYMATVGLLVHQHFIQVYAMTVGHMRVSFHILEVHIALVRISGITAVEVLEEEWIPSQFHGNPVEWEAQRQISLSCQVEQVPCNLVTGFIFVDR